MGNTKKILVTTSIALLSMSTSYGFMDMGDDFMNNSNFTNYDSVNDDFINSVTGDQIDGIQGTNYETREDGVIVVSEGGTLELGVNAEVDKIILNNAKSISFGVNASAKILEGTVETADFGVNSEVSELFLKVDELKVSVNANLQSGNIYVYKDFEGGVNSEFKGKMTVYGNTSLSVNSDIEGRYCSLGKVGLGVNSSVNSYSMEGLLGNIDPILDVKILDNEESFQNIKVITTSFDGDFSDAMKKIDSYNVEISALKSQISQEKDEEKKNTLQLELSTKTDMKTNFKTETISGINEVFTSLKDYIDSDERNVALFAKIKNIYVYAVEYENASQVYNICNNSEVTGNVNASYEKNGKLYISGKSFKRQVVLPKKEIESLDTMMDKLSDEKLVKVNSKIDGLQEKIASKKKVTKNDEKNLNMLMDVKELLRNEMLYD